ncbi:hypothetical protein [Saccharothrix hoggarensis]|uniref:Uncharacterized protein n=1 Tax=Saccharothrix hoggarensis TaxID=913853 RepID=A0ABW3QDM0_9PSEU
MTAEPNVAEGQVYEIDVPMFLPPQRKRRAGKPVNRSRPPQPAPLNANWRLHWSKEHKLAQEIATAVMLRARSLRIPTCDHLTVQIHFAPGNNVKADADNLYPSFKRACDALSRPKHTNWVGLHLVPDDTPQFMTKLEPVIHPGPEHERRLWLTVRVGRPGES